MTPSESQIEVDVAVELIEHAQVVVPLVKGRFIIFLHSQNHGGGDRFVEKI